MGEVVKLQTARYRRFRDEAETWLKAYGLDNDPEHFNELLESTIKLLDGLDRRIGGCLHD